MKYFKIKIKKKHKIKRNFYIYPKGCNNNSKKKKKSDMSTAGWHKFGKIAFVAVYLDLVLWWVLTRPEVETDVRWVPKTFFSSTKQITSSTRLHFPFMVFVESTFFTLVALPGYWYSFGGFGDGSIIGGTSFSKEPIGDTLCRRVPPMTKRIYQKFSWFCLVPWIITFAQGMIWNLFDLLYILARTSDAWNYYNTLGVLTCVFFVQALLASEVICMALQGYIDMVNINKENVEFERKKKIFNTETVESVFT